MNEKQKNTLLQLINYYGDLREKIGVNEADSWIEHFNKSERVFNKILKIIDGE